MTLWLMAHVGCWPRSACAACHHVCPRACSNADFHTPSPISWQTGVIPTGNPVARRVPKHWRGARSGGWRHPSSPLPLCLPRAAMLNYCWFSLSGACGRLASCPRESSFRVEARCRRANLHCGTVNGNGAWNLSLSVFQAMSQFQILCSERLK